MPLAARPAKQLSTVCFALQVHLSPAFVRQNARSRSRLLPQALSTTFVSKNRRTAIRHAYFFGGRERDFAEQKRRRLRSSRARYGLPCPRAPQKPTYRLLLNSPLRNVINVSLNGQLGARTSDTTEFLRRSCTKKEYPCGYSIFGGRERDFAEQKRRRSTRKRRDE